MADLFQPQPGFKSKQTCEYFCEEYDKDNSLIQFDERLYHAPEQMFYTVLESLNDTIQSVALFSHNPGITDFVNSLGAGVRIDDMPTCGVYAIEADIDTWKEIHGSPKRFLFFDYPKLGR